MLEVHNNEETNAATYEPFKEYEPIETFKNSALMAPKKAIKFEYKIQYMNAV